LEQVAVDWLKELFGLPAAWTGVLTTGATMSNFTGLAAARRWWGLRRGFDVEADGLQALPPLLPTETVHVGAFKAAAMLGLGRGRVRGPAPDALEQALAELEGEPAILLATAGDVNTGASDPLDHLADLAERYDAWLHVDGAFGLFAAVSPSTRAQVRGI